MRDATGRNEGSTELYTSDASTTEASKIVICHALSFTHEDYKSSIEKLSWEIFLVCMCYYCMNPGCIVTTKVGFKSSEKFHFW
jgi:hypothetical protein